MIRVSITARSLAICLAPLLLATTTLAQVITGTVYDTQNRPIADAVVTLQDGGTVRARTMTDSQGEFSLSYKNAAETSLVVNASGFSTVSRKLSNNGVWDFTIILQPAPIGAAVTVSVTRAESRLSETPASIVVLTRESLESTAALTIDDSLRQIAGFTLFRRSSSRTTNPTAQGANLRGVSGSGASRAAVLFDGLSLNDAFGGWTYWSRVPMVAVEQAEVLRGGASSFYGTGGLSGAVNLVPQRPIDGEPVLNFRASAGSQNTYDGSLYTAIEKDGWVFDLAAETFQTGGYIPTVENQRGLADTRSNSRHNNAIFGVEKRFGIPPQSPGAAEKSGSRRIFFKGNLFSERRDNGTTLTNNRTYFRRAAAGADYSNRGLGEFQLRSFLDTQIYDQTFSAISADRNAETLARLQRVPSQAAGANVFWTRVVKKHVLATSAELREVRGFSDEVGFINGRPATLSGSGGHERTFSFFAQDNLTVTGRLNLNLGFRIDYWNNFDARSATRAAGTNLVTVVNFPDRDEAAVSPRVAAIYKINNAISVYGSYSRSFRAPTLNELYRGFRVGNILTQANENLKAEYANTLEGGVNFSSSNRRLGVRANAFVTTVSDPVVSVTLSTTPTLITRQRQNVGETRTRGLELDFEFALRHDIRLSASYLLADSRVAAFPGNTSLIGKFLPQIAGQQLNFQFIYRPRSSLLFGIQSRISGGQFEDDLNTLRLRPFFVVDATAAYRVNKYIEFFAAAENLFNTRYDIGLTPNRTVAAPAFVRAGFRINLGGR